MIADQLHLVFLAVEVLREFVGSLLRERIRVLVCADIDIGDVASWPRRNAGDNKQAYCVGPAILVEIALIGDPPALNGGERFLRLGVDPPFKIVVDRIKGREALGGWRAVPWRVSD